MEKTNIKRNLLIVGGAVIIVAVIIAIIVIAINVHNKPNEEKAKSVVETYVQAMSDGDGEKMINLIDLEGYIIFNKNGEKDFDENYKNKSELINNYLSEKNYSDLNGASQKISSDFENVYGYYSYTVNEITSIEKSDKSKNLIVVRCKVQLKSNRYSTVNSARFYLLKNNGDYKVVGIDM